MRQNRAPRGGNFILPQLVAESDILVVFITDNLKIKEAHQKDRHNA